MDLRKDSEEDGAPLEKESLLIFPNEIIEQILLQPVLSVKDILSLASCSKRLHTLLFHSANSLWKIKFHDEFHLLTRISKDISNHFPFAQTGISDVVDWYDVIKLRTKIKPRLRQLLYTLSENSRNKGDFDCGLFGDLDILVSEHPLGLLFLLDELYLLLDPRNDFDLTLKYYGKKALTYLRQQQLRKLIEDFLAQDPEHHHMEHFSVMLAQWCQPDRPIFATTTFSVINSMAIEAQQVLRSSSPDHPALRIDLNDFQSTKVLTDSLWFRREGAEVLRSLNEVFFDNHGFQGNSQNYYDVENSYIDAVLQRKKGIPISLCVVYAAIAKRLGVLCEPVNFPSHFLLRWKESPSATDDSRAFIYIDVFEKGKQLTQQEAESLLPFPHHFQGMQTHTIFQKAEHRKVFDRQIRNLIGIHRESVSTSPSTGSFSHLIHVLELLLLLDPSNNESRVLLARIYLHSNADLRRAVAVLEGVRIPISQPELVQHLLNTARARLTVEEEDEERPQVKRRESPQVEFAVGLVVRHAKYDYTGVICGWDLACSAGEDWVHQMGVHMLNKKTNQPFYNVLVDDGTNRYCAQENLRLTNPVALNHPEVGRHFSRFLEGVRYELNAAAALEYPEDAASAEHVVRQFLSRESP